MILQGDCRDIMATLPAESVDLILTDPPYGLAFNGGTDLVARREASLGLGGPGPARPILGDIPADWESLMREFLRQAQRVLKPGACCCCCGGGGGPEPIFARLTLWMDEMIGFKQAVVWDKGGLGMGWHYRRVYEFVLVAQKPGAGKWYGGNNVPNLLRIPKIIPSAQDHPTVKPTALMETFIRLHSAPGDLVLDPFCGSGTTGEAALRLGRRFLGIELDPKWVAIAQARLRMAHEQIELRCAEVV